MRKQAPRGQATNLLTVTQLVRSGARIGTCRQEAAAWPSVLLATLFTVSKRSAEGPAYSVARPQKSLGLRPSCHHPCLAPGFGLSSGELLRRPPST